MKKLVLAFCFINSFCHAQFDYFPLDQSSYNEGIQNYYKDFHKIVIEKDLKPCINKDEMYNFKVLIAPDATIKFVKDTDEKDVFDNKCAFDLAREVAKYQTGWKPAIINGEKKAAIAHFIIFPDDLFEKYKEGYDASQAYVLPDYEGGINEFRKKVSNTIDLSKFNWKGKFGVVTKFVVEKDGTLSNIILEESSGLKEFDEMVVRSIKKIKNKWTPGKIHSTPIRSHMRFPLSFSME